MATNTNKSTKRAYRADVVPQHGTKTCEKYDSKIHARTYPVPKFSNLHRPRLFSTSPHLRVCNLHHVRRPNALLFIQQPHDAHIRPSFNFSLAVGMHVHSSRPVVHGQRGAVLDALRHFPLDPHPSKYWSERRVTFSARLFVSVHVRVVRRLVRGNLLRVPVRRRHLLRGSPGDDDRGMNHRTIHFRDGRIQFAPSRSRGGRRSRRRRWTRLLLVLLVSHPFRRQVCSLAGSSGSTAVHDPLFCDTNVMIFLGPIRFPKLLSIFCLMNIIITRTLESCLRSDTDRKRRRRRRRRWTTIPPGSRARRQNG